MGKPLRISSYFLISLNVLFLASAVALIVLVTIDVRDQALVEAEAKAQLFMDRNLATHRYFTHHLRPKVFETTRNFLGPGVFDPVWMSSTYALRQIQHYFLELNPEGYYYREAAIDARSPSNEADENEKSFLQDLAVNPNLPTRSAILNFDGKPFLTVMKKSEALIPACLRCHSSPQEAPVGLIEVYGPDRSFGRQLGQVTSVSSVRIPLSQAYAQANTLIWRMSFGSIVILLTLFILIILLNKKYFLSPLAVIRDKASLIVNDPERLGEQIDKPKGREFIELVDAFNAMSKRLRQGRDDLGQLVHDRTQHLERANKELEEEIRRRKEIQETLSESEQRFRLMFQRHSAVMLLIEPETGNIVDANSSAQEFYGYELTKLRGMSIQQINTLPADEIAQERKKALLQNRNYFVFQHRTATGEVRDVEVHSSPIEFEGQKILFSIIHDITERKLAEEQIRKSEEKYRILADNMEDVIWQTTPDLVFTYVSPSIKKLRGLDPSEVTGRPIWEFVSPESIEPIRKRVAERFQLLLSDRDSFVPHSYETEQKRKDGTTLWTETVTSPVFDEANQLIAFQGITRDVTERKLSEQSLRSSERTNAMLIEKAPIGIGTMQDSLLVNANPKFLEVFGYDTMQEVLGTPLEAFYSPEERKFITQRYKDRLAGKPVPMHYEVKGLKKNGKLFDLEVWPTVVDYEEKPAVLTFCVDNTEAKSLRHQLLQAQKMEAIGTLAGGIAHDFNNILQVVLGYSELLLAAREETDKDYVALDKINSASLRGADLVQNLMMFSRKIEPNLKPLNLNEEVVQIQKLLSRTIPKDIKINVHLSGDLELVNADISQIGQVLMNLAINARDALPDGGMLNFGTTNVDLDEAYCAAHPGFEPRKYVLLAVSDTGVGMSKETLAHIFEPFFTTKEIGKGTGLGLATVFGIVKQHKGHITCYSEVGRGTTFKIYLPAIEHATEAETQENITTIIGGTETILLVDDEEHLRDLGATILEHYGYEVLTAGNGKDALDIYRTNHEKISLVILDLVMPEMDGKKCLAEILNINPESHVLIASGHSEGILAVDSSFPEAKGLVAKPYEMKKLLQKVRDVLGASD